jgi:hypothetical protein
MKQLISTLFLTLLMLICGQNALAQFGAHPQLVYDWAPDQLSASYLWTIDDYSLKIENSALRRTKLNGGALEYAWRHKYPWEIVATAQYSEGDPLGQKLITVAGGVGYCHRFMRWTPYARIEAGAAQTSSSGLMYLYKAPRWGFASVTSVGGDFQLSPHWGIRVGQLQNEYLPFGSRGSVYWSAGSGITYRIRP